MLSALCYKLALGLFSFTLIPFGETLNTVLALVPTHTLAAIVYIAAGIALAALSRPASRSKTFYTVFTTCFLTCVFAVLILFWAYRNRRHASSVGIAAALTVAVSGASLVTQVASILAAYAPVVGMALSVAASFVTVVWTGMPVAPRRLNVLRGVIVAIGAGLVAVGVFLLISTRQKDGGGTDDTDLAKTRETGLLIVGIQTAIVVGVSAAVTAAVVVPPLTNRVWRWGE